LKTGGDTGPYKEAIEELILHKKREEKKLSETKKNEGGEVEGDKDDSP